MGRRPNPEPHRLSINEQLTLCAVFDGAETSRDVSADLGLTMHQACGCLFRLVKFGALRRLPKKFYAHDLRKPMVRYARR